jgi:hypothetical protein
VSFARDARAAPLTVRLDYAAGPGCPDAAAFKAGVLARLAYDPFNDSASDHVLVRIEPRDAAMDGRIEWRDAGGNWTGEQTFTSAATDCPRLVRAMGFALAVEIQLLARAAAESADRPDAAAETAPPPPDANAPPRVAPPVAAMPPLPPAVPTIADAGRAGNGEARSTVAAGAGPVVGFGMSSAPVLLGRVFGALEWPHVSVELAALASLPATTRRADGAGFSQQHLLGSAAVCATVTRSNGCVVLNAGEARLAGEDIDRPTSANVAIVQAGVRAGMKQPLGRLASLSVHADGLVNVTRWTARLDAVPVWTAPRFAAALGVDLGVQFR